MGGYGVFKPGATMMNPGQLPGRFAWLYAHPIIVGEFAATSALFVMAHCVIPEQNRRHAWTRWLVLAALVAIVIATRSRGPIVAFAVAAMVLSMRGLTHSWLPSIAVPTAIAAAAAVAMFLSPVEILRMGEGSQNPILALLYREQTVEQLMTFTGRTELWKGIGPLIQDRYLVGYGYLGGRGLILGVAPWAGYAHSAFVESLLDLGLIGSVLIWSAVVSALFPGRCDSGVNPRRLRRDRGIVFSVMVFIVLSAITTDSFAGAPAYAAFVTLVCVLVAERLRAIPS
jgi:O-antigen ligase